ncbi:hypothetical protein ETAA8_40540 [Anatilimnocola aggregata]|uniref:Uncharacterized protein n=1 Tax=Anatilimnocola aggregata TaxID=2528021 RepID=A0A517YFE1_9BACT|nr:hypothetical protein ETAA8_40540 [Anatilimnocola aggregata]
MRNATNSDDLSPEERRHELANILARGLLRLVDRQRAAGNARPPASTKTLLDSQPEALSFGKKPCSVSTRVNGPESF